MDPRPYHYEYRRPRLNNPTYQSMNLYDSLYHRGILNRYQNNNNIGTYQPKYQFHKQIYQQSILNKKNNQINQQRQSPNLLNSMHNRRLSGSLTLNNNQQNQLNRAQSNRPYSNRSNSSNISNLNQQRPSILASYGKNSIPNSKIFENQKIPPQTSIYDKLNQFSVYQKQQKPYSIIGNIPRSVSTSLRQYPKLTLQHKLIQQGKYLPK